jgi:hypothetical protein
MMISNKWKYIYKCSKYIYLILDKTKEWADTDVECIYYTLIEVYIHRRTISGI